MEAGTGISVEAVEFNICNAIVLNSTLMDDNTQAVSNNGTICRKLLPIRKYYS